MQRATVPKWGSALVSSLPLNCLRRLQVPETVTLFLTLQRTYRQIYRQILPLGDDRWQMAKGSKPFARLGGRLRSERAPTPALKVG